MQKKLPVFEKILNKIKKYDKITFFIHESPDFDAFGSAYGLKAFLHTYFPKIKSYVMGTFELKNKYGSGLFPFETKPVSKSFLSQSLGIIVDTANQARILTGRHNEAKELIRIDHHPKIETIGNLEWIDHTYPAAAEMVGVLIDQLSYDFNKEIAQYIYAGILTDTGRFLYSNTSPRTHLLTAKLLETKFDVQHVLDNIYLKKLRQKQFETFAFSKMKYTPAGFGYIVLDKKISEKYQDCEFATVVGTMMGLHEIKIWCSLYYDVTTNKWKGSLRSRHYEINKIAQKFNGGGHALASGFKLDNISQFKNVIKNVELFLKNN
ncbi:DHH family phosphoesterase [[Mycoplasma] testudinis]|uniref:DHH family phosphoesterase n=1 Tax=[Mycoplasma] testudinis TaxID=33924 RepID=UPI00048043F4|nr:bifunctional oligoribonuclease/PAP phosphatase NrnA [[Mycoplasma] testudinis]